MAEINSDLSIRGSVVERVTGYDARDLSTAPWSEERRETYLYKVDVTRPLSADTTVWPSIFEPGSPEARTRFGYQDTWASLDKLKAATLQRFQSRGLTPFYTVAITLITGDYSSKDNVNWSSIIPHVNPDRRSSSWSFLGFDVCDVLAVKCFDELWLQSGERGYLSVAQDLGFPVEPIPPV